MPLITPQQLEDLLRQCEQRHQIKRGDEQYLQRRFACECGRIHTRITELYLCSASHHDDAEEVS